MDGFGDVSGHVEWHIVADTLRESAADLLHRLLDIFSHLHGIGARKHIDGKHRSIGAVDAALGIVGLRFERDARNVAQTYYGAIGISPDDYIFKLRH